MLAEKPYKIVTAAVREDSVDVILVPGPKYTPEDLRGFWRVCFTDWLPEEQYRQIEELVGKEDTYEFFRAAIRNEIERRRKLKKVKK